MNAEDIAKRFQKLTPFLDEKQRRILAAVEGEVWGPGGISVVARTTGLSRNTVKRGKADLREASSLDAAFPKSRVRLPGGGRKKATGKDPDLAKALEELIEPSTRGDPESPLKWTCKSLRRLALELRQRGHRISHVAVGELLRDMGYSLQANRKTLEGASHPDRNAQFEHIHEKVKEFQAAGQPVMLDFYADWCTSCKEMEKYTFSNAGVQKDLAGFVLLKADVTSNGPADQALLRRFGVYGPPTTAFFGAHGRECAAFRLVGFKPADEFREHLARFAREC